MKSPGISLAAGIVRRILPYIYIALGVGILVFMAVGIAPNVAVFLGGYGAPVQIIAVALPALALGTGIVLGGERSPRLENISNRVYYPSLLAFIQLMFSTGRMPGKYGRAAIELPWYTQIDEVGQRSCDFRGIAGWTAVAFLLVLMAVTQSRRRRQNPES